PVETIVRTEHVTVVVKSDLKRPILDELSESIRTAAELYKPAALFIDLAETKNADEATLAELSRVIKELRGREIKVYTLRAVPSIQRKIFQNGLDEVFQPRQSEGEALAELKQAVKPSPKINVEFVNPFLEGTMKTLQVQAATEVQAGTPYASGRGPAVHADIIATLGIVSGTFNGSIALCFPKAVFLAVAGRMVGENYSDITDDNADAAGELLNIIFGQAKEVLNRKGFTIQQAIPTVVHGEAMKLRNVIHEPTIIVPMVTSAGKFHIQIGLAKG
ncbi:MAG TPA: chemotaxis protein CheX, partial [Bdellovibrionales bacterium]|nr:chemotaxis protein CheX [Bdellovibrionales bacterium]